MDAIDEIVAEFLAETRENLDQLERDLLALEQEPGTAELLDGVFRTVHTIKGISGVLAFGRLERLAHVGEDLLSGLRDGHVALTDARSIALLRLVDAVRGLLADIERTGAEGQAGHGELVALLTALLDEGPAPTGATLDLARGRLVACVTDPRAGLPGPAPAAPARRGLAPGEPRQQPRSARMQPIDTLWSRLPRGSVDVVSVPGRGSTVRLTLPSALAVAPAPPGGQP